MLYKSVHQKEPIVPNAFLLNLPNERNYYLSQFEVTNYEYPYMNVLYALILTTFREAHWKLMDEFDFTA